LLMSDVKHDYIRSKMALLAELAAQEVAAMFAPLEAQARAELRSDGFAERGIRIECALDMRYAGQGYEITLPVAADALGADGLTALRARFDEQHRSMFGHMAPEEPVEVVSYRVRGIGLVPPVELPKFKREGSTLAAARRGTRSVWFDGAMLECPVYQREKLDVGLAVSGPAVLDQFDCTTILCPGQVARVDDWKNLIVTMRT